jgi:hypothetical protein
MEKDNNREHSDKGSNYNVSSCYLRKIFMLAIVKVISSVVLHIHNTCLSRLLYVKLSMENNTSLS